MIFVQVVQSVEAASEVLAAPYQRGGDSILEMILNAGPMVKFVLLVLLALSVGCWWIIFMKARLFSRAEKESNEFLGLYQQRTNFPVIYRESKLYQYGYLPQVFHSGYTEWARLSRSVENAPESSQTTDTYVEGVEKAMEGAILSQHQRMERSLALLATTGSTAPFIGLFGTVWGIMTSFQRIGLKGAANLAVVAPGISEALIATAMGLVAAIPAVVAYNYFANRIRAFDNEMHYFVNDFSNMVKREWLRRLSTVKPNQVQRVAVQD